MITGPTLFSSPHRPYKSHLASDFLKQERSRHSRRELRPLHLRQRGDSQLTNPGVDVDVVVDLIPSTTSLRSTPLHSRSTLGLGVDHPEGWAKRLAPQRSGEGVEVWEKSEGVCGG